MPRFVPRYRDSSAFSEASPFAAAWACPSRLEGTMPAHIEKRRGGRALALASFTGGLLMAACEAGGPGAPHVIPGPTVPSPIPTISPYRWDTRAELEIWTTNRVSRGPLAIDGVDADAFIRIDPASADWVLRGPDLDPPARAIRTL